MYHTSAVLIVSLHPAHVVAWFMAVSPVGVSTVSRVLRDPAELDWLRYWVPVGLSSLRRGPYSRSACSSVRVRTSGVIAMNSLGVIHICPVIVYCMAWLLLAACGYLITL